MFVTLLSHTSSGKTGESSFVACVPNYGHRVYNQARAALLGDVRGDICGLPRFSDSVIYILELELMPLYYS